VLSVQVERLLRWAGLLLTHWFRVRPLAPHQPNTSRSRDFRYLVFGHRTPGDRASVVVTRDLINRMKTDLTEEAGPLQFTANSRVIRAVG